MRCRSSYRGICEGEARPGLTACQSCHDHLMWFNHHESKKLPCAIPWCNNPRYRVDSYCRDCARVVDKYKTKAARADVRRQLASMLRAMERRNGYTHPGIVYAWAFPDAGIIKVGHSVESAEVRREYACWGVRQFTGKWEAPILELEVPAAEPASLERYVCERLPAPLFRREFFAISTLPTIRNLLEL